MASIEITLVAQLEQGGQVQIKTDSPAEALAALKEIQSGTPAGPGAVAQARERAKAEDAEKRKAAVDAKKAAEPEITLDDVRWAVKSFIDLYGPENVKEAKQDAQQQLRDAFDVSRVSDLAASQYVEAVDHFTELVADETEGKSKASEPDEPEPDEGDDADDDADDEDV